MKKFVIISDLSSSRGTFSKYFLNTRVIIFATKYIANITVNNHINVRNFSGPIYVEYRVLNSYTHIWSWLSKILFPLNWRLPHLPMLKTLNINYWFKKFRKLVVYLLRNLWKKEQITREQILPISSIFCMEYSKFNTPFYEISTTVINPTSKCLFQAFSNQYTSEHWNVPLITPAFSACWIQSNECWNLRPLFCA